MALIIGSRFGPYQILLPLGAGGMGEVYRARDTKLNRDVALKILPPEFTLDPDRLARFEREAQVLASLNHPNIAAIYGVEDSGHAKGLVLEFVDGPTLDDALTAPIQLQEALSIARQIAEALEVAHDQGIVHRDLKPANVKVRPDGAVKVLDFGLAKLATPDVVQAASGRRVELTASPTLSLQATFAGMILGTAAYMSPEQAKGKAVDRRTDIWAFGVVLWEMLTGRRMYDGETAAEILARVIEREPDLNALPASTPPSIRFLLERCLTKDPRNRLQAIGEARIALTRAIADPDAGSGAGTITNAASGFRRTAALAGALITALVVALLATILMWAPWRKTPLSSAIRVSVDIGADASLATDVGTAAVLSPDGQLLAFAAQTSPRERSQLYVRRLTQLTATALAGTDDAHGPFFSPDGEWIGFFAGGKLKKVATTGGAPATICDAPAGRGGYWTDAQTIVFQPDIGAAGNNSRLARVSTAGGMPEPITAVEEVGRPRFPQVLPGGTAMVYTRYSPGGVADVMLQRLPAGERKPLLHGAYGRYVPSGHLLYIQEATLFAVPFDVGRLALAGVSVPVLEGVTAAENTAAAQFAASDSGTLAYLPGRTVNSDPPISWIDRARKTMPLVAKPMNWSNPQFSPDGSRLAIDVVETSPDIWVYDVPRETLSRLTFNESGEAKPVWTPDGHRIAFSSNRDPRTGANLYWQRADGAGESQRLTTSERNQLPGSWHPSGKYLAFSQENPVTNPDIWILPMEGDEASGWKPGQPTVFLNSPANENEPMFSPDGRWLAYQSNESGRPEVYVRPFPGPGGKWEVSSGGGAYPTWSRARPELFFMNGNQQILAATYTVDGDSFKANRAELVSDARIGIRPRQRSFNVHPDGNRFVVATAPETAIGVKQDRLVFIFNFFDELRRLAPVSKR
jgi:Tol biopolymer transport system component